MTKQLHQTFQQILENALNVQIEREHKKVVQAKQRSPWQYMEEDETAEELGIKHNDYLVGGWF